MSTISWLGLLAYFYCLIFTSVSADDVSTTTVENSITYCEAYCDIHGFYQQGKWCIGDHRPVYCCGDTTERYCCFEAEEEAENEPISTCPKSNWWFYQRLIVGMLTSLIIMLVLAACCYYCCSADTQHRARQQATRDAEMASISTSEGMVSLPSHFDPESPFAFEPPAYDSLPKDPPNYGEIFGDAPGQDIGEPCVISSTQPEGCDNPSFVTDPPDQEDAVLSAPDPAVSINRTNADSVENIPTAENQTEVQGTSIQISGECLQETRTKEIELDSMPLSMSGPQSPPLPPGSSPTSSESSSDGTSRDA